MKTEKLLFLGTCAADFGARLQTDLIDVFDNDVRRSSSALLSGSILIDCGPHVMGALRIAKVPIGKICDIFLTHLHSDHFRADCVAKIASDHAVRLWVREDADLPPIEGVRIMRMTLGQTYEVQKGLRVTSLWANHTRYPQHLLFEWENKSLLYALDGAWMCTETFNFLRGKRLHAVVLDCTVGDYEGDWRAAEHNSIPMLRLLLPSLRAAEIIDENTRVYISHLAPSLHKSHAQTARICATFGVTVAYDGMQIDV